MSAVLRIRKNINSEKPLEKFAGSEIIMNWIVIFYFISGISTV